MWDLSRLSQVLTPLEVQVVRQIPLSSHPYADQILWHHTTNGKFTVRSAYHNLLALHPLGRANAPRSSSVMNPNGWLMLWRLPLPPKVSWFVWRCLQNAVAVNANIARKRIPIDPLCLFCGQRAESVVHLMVVCEVARVMIVQMMKSKKLLASQGGPLILSLEGKARKLLATVARLDIEDFLQKNVFLEMPTY
ncbi:hypothetical protein HHK36_024731 [Tetracentron sinense]|uniref:Reverse transcriptase zinc-binding domain-containing protein n=1 Tax=Tetracentron sinense TaxID=13715 RepID=A0A834YJG4_TETSI|nr:hypothetical protein HHK36_024731 [Tetracentron sinense]